MKPIIDILPADLEKVCSILDAHTPDFEVWAFGSRVNWKARATSDLDIAVINDIPLTVSEMENLKEAFSSSDLPFKVDVVDWASTSEEFKSIIKTRHIIIQNKRVSRIPVSSIARVVIGGTPSRNKPENWNGRVPWATAKDIVSANRYLYKTREHITDHGLANSSAKIMPAGTIVITARGTVGALCQLGQEMSFNQTCYAIVPKDGMDSNYLYYALKGSVKQMRSLTYGTVFDTITKKTFNDWEIPKFPLDTQLAISNILGSLDDKIELNGRMNKTLEEIARTLFKSWFIDFDPVRAKIDGRWQPGQSLPGLPTELYDLFPDRLVPSILGEIPESWKLVSLSKIIELNPRRSLKKSTLAPYLSMSNMPTYGHVPLKIIDRNFHSGMKFTKGDTLVARITPCLENGKTAFVGFLNDEEIGWGSTEFIVMRPKVPIPNEFAYCLARSNRFRDFAVKNMTGTSGRQRVSANSLANYQIPMPTSSEILELFGLHIKPLFEFAQNSVEESHTLSELRDTLLPKLLSGEIRVENFNDLPI